MAKMRDSISQHRRVRRLRHRPEHHHRRHARGMAETLWEIQNGEFARDWILENKAGQPQLQGDAPHPRRALIEEVGGELRSMFSWIKKDA